MEAESIEDTDSDAGSEGDVNSDEISSEESISDASATDGIPEITLHCV